MHNQSKKFLFDINNFDAPEIEEVEEEIIEEEIEPPPPTFSEEELEAAKAVSFSQGKSEGIQEERNSRHQYIAGILDQINNSFTSVFANEIYREKTYEQEAINLAVKIVGALAPTLQRHLGQEALRDTIEKTVMLQSKQSEIVIEVPKGTAVEVDEALQKIWPDPENTPKYRILESDDLPEGACKMAWKDGGMVRNPEETAQKMKLELEELLDKTDAAVRDTPNNDIKNQEVIADNTSENTQQGKTGEENDRSDG